MKCMCCGKETELPLCETCEKTADIKKVAEEVLCYAPGNGENALWNEIAEPLKDKRNFRDLAFVLAEALASPQKEYIQIKTIAENKQHFPKNSRNWLYRTAPVCLNGGLAAAEENDVRAWLLPSKAADYAYPEAEAQASVLLQATEKSRFVYQTLADFYINTRRNDSADALLREAAARFPDDTETWDKLATENAKKREKPYLPAPKENKEAAQKAYQAFLASLGIEVQTQAERKKANVPIAKEDYPEPREHTAADFDSFVAFDLETTGFRDYDDIIEIGAVKVIGGEVKETAEFCFRTFVKPTEKKVTPEITALTGISPEDVQNAPSNAEALKSFLDFADDGILLGFNCMKFDSRLLTRAGRYAHIIIANEYFDVMRYAKKNREKLGITEKEPSLGALAAKYGVKNPCAHRALADALTTARVFFKLREQISAEPDLPDADELLAGF